MGRQGEPATSGAGEFRGSKLVTKHMGLSLVELMIAVALSATVVMLTVMAYTGSANTWLAIGDRLDLNQNTRRAMGRIAQETRMARQITVPTSSRVELVSFDGESIVYRLENGEILRNDQPLASAVSVFSVAMEGSDVLRVRIEAEQGGQSYAMEQRVKLRNKKSQG